MVPPAHAAMNRDAAIHELTTRCESIGKELVALHPAVTSLGNSALAADMYKTMFQLTQDLETFKKLIKRAGEIR